MNNLRVYETALGAVASVADITHQVSIAKGGVL